MNDDYFNQNNEMKYNKKYKDTSFKYLFNNEQEISNFYKAITEKYINPNDIQLENLDSLVIADWCNDVSFRTKDNSVVILFEQQSSKCSNMTIRCLVYYTNLIQRFYNENYGADDENKNGFKDKIYSSTVLKVPKPEFYVLYIGKNDINNQELFTEHNKNFEAVTSFSDDIFLQVRVKNIDIHYNKLSTQQIQQSNTLAGYSYIIQQYEMYDKKLKFSIIDDNARRRIAMTKAIEDCRKKSYLLDYLDRKEFKTMVQKDFTFEDYCRVKAEDSRREGLQEGLQQGGIKTLILDNLEEGFTKEKIVSKLQKRFQLTQEQAEQYFEQFS